MDHDFGVKSKDSLFSLRSQRFSPYVFFPQMPYSFMLYIKVCNSFWVNFCTRCEVWIKVYFSAYGCSVIPAPFVEKAVLSLLNCFCSFVKNQLGIFVWVDFRALYSVLLICVSVLPPIPHNLDCYSYSVSLEIE